MDEIVKSTLFAHWGVARTTELLEAGVSRSVLSAMVDQKVLLRPFRGVYCTPRAVPHWAQLRSQGYDSTCETAARAIGLWVLKGPSALHASYRRTASLPETIIHMGKPVVKVVSHKRRFANRVLDIVVSAIRCLPELRALVIAESAVVQGKISLTELRAAVAKSGRVRERALVERINPFSESILETVGRYLLEEAGFHVQIQVGVRGLGRVDAMVDGILGIEFDGRESHDTKAGYDEDRRRNNVAMVEGIPVLRVTYALVIHHPEEFIRTVSDALTKLIKRGHGV